MEISFYTIELRELIHCQSSSYIITSSTQCQKFSITIIKMQNAIIMQNLHRELTECIIQIWSFTVWKLPVNDTASSFDTIQSLHPKEQESICERHLEDLQCATAEDAFADEDSMKML